ncbi:hypothetical protein ACHAQH_009950 [Verticillium albo-atrum]
MAFLNDAMPQSPLLATSSHVSILDIFFPGFTGVSAVFQQLASGKLDNYAYLLCICGLLLFFGKATFRLVEGLVETHLVTRTYVHDSSELYDMFDSWFSRRFAANARSLLATVDNEQGRALADPVTIGAEKKPLRFSPWKERLPFWYHGRLLTFQCTQTESGYFPRKTMTISCFSRSPQVLKELFNECRVEYLKLAEDKTSVFEHHNGGWKRTNSRDIRPMDTVAMKEEGLLRDVESFLNPKARDWYMRRGIPYRKGYLLYGSPGTGKSSFSLSVAGSCGLDIYVLSLASTNDSCLSKLFADLPQRCVILLEDIDAVGVARTHESDGEDSESGTDVSRRGSGSRGTVSLSGLLNVLDGVASPEGRVPIMTTNHIVHLDGALIRPGRVDKKVEFQLTDQSMAYQLFSIVFQQLEAEEPDFEVRSENNKAALQLAEQFAAEVPELEFSPADILSFLLEHRESPSDAVAHVGSWVSSSRASTTPGTDDHWHPA